MRHSQMIGQMRFIGEWAIIRLRATTRDCPYEMGKCVLGGKGDNSDQD